MKKVLILLMLILLCACNGNDREDGQNRPDETDPKPETVDTLKPLTDEYLNKMLFIFLLGYDIYSKKRLIEKLIEELK